MRSNRTLIALAALITAGFVALTAIESSPAQDTKEPTKSTAPLSQPLDVQPLPAQKPITVLGAGNGPHTTAPRALSASDIAAFQYASFVNYEACRRKDHFAPVVANALTRPILEGTLREPSQVIASAEVLEWARDAAGFTKPLAPFQPSKLERELRENHIGYLKSMGVTSILTTVGQWVPGIGMVKPGFDYGIRNLELNMKHEIGVAVLKEICPQCIWNRNKIVPDVNPNLNLNHPSASPLPWWPSAIDSSPPGLELARIAFGDPDPKRRQVALQALDSAFGHLVHTPEPGKPYQLPDDEFLRGDPRIQRLEKLIQALEKTSDPKKQQQLLEKYHREVLVTTVAEATRKASAAREASHRSRAKVNPGAPAAPTGKPANSIDKKDQATNTARSQPTSKPADPGDNNEVERQKLQAYVQGSIQFAQGATRLISLLDPAAGRVAGIITEFGSDVAMSYVSYTLVAAAVSGPAAPFVLAAGLFNGVAKLIGAIFGGGPSDTEQILKAIDTVRRELSEFRRDLFAMLENMDRRLTDLLVTNFNIMNLRFDRLEGQIARGFEGLQEAIRELQAQVVFTQSLLLCLRQEARIRWDKENQSRLYAALSDTVSEDPVNPPPIPESDRYKAIRTLVNIATGRDSRFVHGEVIQKDLNFPGKVVERVQLFKILSNVLMDPSPYQSLPTLTRIYEAVFSIPLTHCGEPLSDPVLYSWAMHGVTAAARDHEQLWRRSFGPRRMTEALEPGRVMQEVLQRLQKDPEIIRRIYPVYNESIEQLENLVKKEYRRALVDSVKPGKDEVVPPYDVVGGPQQMPRQSYLQFRYNIDGSEAIGPAEPRQVPEPELRRRILLDADLRRAITESLPPVVRMLHEVSTSPQEKVEVVFTHMSWGETKYYFATHDGNCHDYVQFRVAPLKVTFEVRFGGQALHQITVQTEPIMYRKTRLYSIMGLFPRRDINSIRQEEWDSPGNGRCAVPGAVWRHVDVSISEALNGKTPVETCHEGHVGGNPVPYVGGYPPGAVKRSPGTPIVNIGDIPPQLPVLIERLKAELVRRKYKVVDSERALAPPDSKWLRNELQKRCDLRNPIRAQKDSLAPGQLNEEVITQLRAIAAVALTEAGETIRTEARALYTRMDLDDVKGKPLTSAALIQQLGEARKASEERLRDRFTAAHRQAHERQLAQGSSPSTHQTLKDGFNDFSQLLYSQCVKVEFDQVFDELTRPNLVSTFVRVERIFREIAASAETAIRKNLDDERGNTDSGYDKVLAGFDGLKQLLSISLTLAHGRPADAKAVRRLQAGDPEVLLDFRKFCQAAALQVPPEIQDLYNEATGLPDRGLVIHLARMGFPFRSADENALLNYLRSRAAESERQYLELTSRSPGGWHPILEIPAKRTAGLCQP
jgi:hypothetical protein